MLQAVERLRPIAEGLDLSLAQLSLAWVLRQKNVASAIVGVTRPEQLEENVKAAAVSLPADALAAIDEALGSVVRY